MLTVTKTFYYFSLEIGNIFIGWFGTILYLALAIIFVTETNRFSIPVLLIVLAMICTAHVIGCILLMIGVMKNSYLLILPWLFGQLLVILASFVIIVYSLIKSPILTALCVDLVVTTLIVFDLYLWICVYSIFKKIEYKTKKKYANLQEETSVGGGA